MRVVVFHHAIVGKRCGKLLIVQDYLDTEILKLFYASTFPFGCSKHNAFAFKVIQTYLNDKKICWHCLFIIKFNLFGIISWNYANAWWIRRLWGPDENFKLCHYEIRNLVSIAFPSHIKWQCKTWLSNEFSNNNIESAGQSTISRRKNRKDELA